MSFKLQPLLPRHWRIITYGTMGKRPLHYYVYAWIDNGKLFYVGCGKGLRAWAEHRGPCQERRNKSVKFRVLILKHDMTKKDAHAYERQQIIKHKPTANVRQPNAVT